MTIGEYIKATDRKTYNKLLKLCDFKVKKPIALGVIIENLMKKHDSFKRVGRKVRQNSCYSQNQTCFFIACSADMVSQKAVNESRILWSFSNFA